MKGLRLVVGLFAALACVDYIAQLGNAQYYPGGSLTPHTHSSIAQGGSTLAPRALSMTSVSTATFAGALNANGVVAMSTGSCKSFAAAVYTYNKQSLAIAVTGSTMSFTVQGGTVQVSGILNASMTGGCVYPIWALWVDGAYGAGASATVAHGIGYCGNNTPCSIPLAGRFNVSKGASHTFALLLSCYPDTGTLTLSASIGVNTVSQFCVDEYMGR